MSTRAKTIFLTALSILMFSFVSKGQDTVKDIFRQSFLRAEAAYRNQPYKIPSVAIPKMIPPFNNDSDKMAYTREHRPEHHVFSLGKDANIIRLHDNLNILSKIIDEGAKYSDSLVIDLAYEIGFSYVDLLLYHKGLNFLDIARISFSTRNIEEYLSALINEVDPRSYDVLEGYIQQIKKQDRKLKSLEIFMSFC